MKQEIKGFIISIKEATLDASERTRPTRKKLAKPGGRAVPASKQRRWSRKGKCEESWAKKRLCLLSDCFGRLSSTAEAGEESKGNSSTKNCRGALRFWGVFQKGFERGR